MRAVAAPITARSTRCSASAPIEAPTSSTIEFSAQGRPQRRDGRPLDTGQRFEFELRHRHQCAGIAARHGDIGVALLDRIDSQPHRGFPAAIAERLARLILHPHRDLGVDKPRGGFERRSGIDERRDQLGIPEEEEFALGVARQRQLRPGDDHGGALVSPHRIERNADLVCHRMIDLAVLGPGDGEPTPKRDNSGSAPGHNCDQRPSRPFVQLARAANGLPSGFKSGGGWKTAPGLRG